MSSSNMKIVLVSTDGESFEIEEAAARQMKIISNMIDDDCADKPIPLLNITGETLAKIIEYCKVHTEEKPSEEENIKQKAKEEEEEKNKQKAKEEGEEGEDKQNAEEEADKPKPKSKTEIFDEEFLKELGFETLSKILIASNYLNIKSLLDLISQTLADKIKDKSVEEVREIFGIVNDFTPEEEAEIKKENEWAFE